jgi:lactate dehydrogenase-like 2-hydroxyacid dehydrogenase
MSNRVPLLALGPLMPGYEDGLAAGFEILKADAASLPGILSARGPEIRAIAARGSMKTDAALIDALPALEIVACAGVGYDSVDLAAAARRGVVVTNAPGVLDDEVADFTIGLLLATIRRIPQGDAYVRAGRWAGGAFPLTATLRDRTIGIAGMGRIGQAIAARLEPFSRPIAYHTRRPVDGLAYPHHPTLAGLAEACDALILILPGGPSTRHVVNGEVLRALGPNGVLINVARGSVVDEARLVQALADGEIAAAGLDVFEDEPRPNPALLTMDNVVLQPHVGSGTHHTRMRMAELGVANLVSWFDGNGPVTPVPETPWPRA